MRFAFFVMRHKKCFLVFRKPHENTATAAVHSVSKKIQSNNEPSCPPHTAENWYTLGSNELECCATYCTEKSLLKNEMAQHTNDKATKPNCNNAAGRATDWHITRVCWLPTKVPAMGNTPCTKATHAASLS